MDRLDAKKILKVLVRPLAGNSKLAVSDARKTSHSWSSWNASHARQEGAMFVSYSLSPLVLQDIIGVPADVFTCIVINSVMGPKPTQMLCLLISNESVVNDSYACSAVSVEKSFHVSQIIGLSRQCLFHNSQVRHTISIREELLVIWWNFFREVFHSFFKHQFFIEP